MLPGLFAGAEACLKETQPAAKCAAVADLFDLFQRQQTSWDADHLFDPSAAPGRPAQPQLVPGHEVPRRRLGSERGRAALVHAISHIEFNAINLALDAVCRFGGMPPDYYADWLSVAADEARHFQLLQNRLEQLGHRYGDFTAHNGLWEMCEKTAHDCLARMALVPRVLEARGLDVTPGMIQRLQAAGDDQTVACLEVILDEEVRHVAIGSRWFRYLCDQRELPAEATFIKLLQDHYGGRLKGPFNVDARLAAGFSTAELEALTAL